MKSLVFKLPPCSPLSLSSRYLSRREDLSEEEEEQARSSRAVERNPPERRIDLVDIDLDDQMCRRFFEKVGHRR